MCNSEKWSRGKGTTECWLVVVWLYSRCTGLVDKVARSRDMKKWISRGAYLAKGTRAKAFRYGHVIWGFKAQLVARVAWTGKSTSHLHDLSLLLLPYILYPQTLTQIISPFCLMLPHVYPLHTKSDTTSLWLQNSLCCRFCLPLYGLLFHHSGPSLSYGGQANDSSFSDSSSPVSTLGSLCCFFSGRLSCSLWGWSVFTTAYFLLHFFPCRWYDPGFWSVDNRKRGHVPLPGLAHKTLLQNLLYSPLLLLAGHRALRGGLGHGKQPADKEYLHWVWSEPEINSVK